LKIVVRRPGGGYRGRGFRHPPARTGADYSQTAQVVKAGKAVVVTSSSTSTVR
jgi:hypothetical protein